MDIDILINTINTTAKKEEETETEILKGQIFVTAKPKIQRVSIDETTLEDENRHEAKAVSTYKKAVKERRQLEFEKRLKSRSKNFRDSVEKVKIDNTLSNRPNKKR